MIPRPEGRRDAADGPSPGPTCVPRDDGSCSICGDQGTVAEVLDPAAEGSEGRVRLQSGADAGEERRVALDLLPAAEAGDRVVVHMGFAIGHVRDEADAAGWSP